MENQRTQVDGSGVSPREEGRRSFLGAMGRVALGTLALATPLAASEEALAATRRTAGRRTLAFRHLHTNERLTATYWANGRYQASALRDINEILRDWRTGQKIAIDRNLLDLLFDLRSRLRTAEPFQVISGYRSPATNAMLATNSDGVARRSLHMEGKAIDISLDTRSLKMMHRTALALKRGGVGYYPASDFIHVDTGPVRQWGQGS